MDWKVLGFIPGRDKGFYFLLNVHTGSGAHPAFCKMCIGDLSPGLNRLNAEGYHSHPYNTEVENEWSYALFPPVCFTLLGEFAKLGKVTVSFVKSLSLYVRPHETSGLPLGGFS
jgi:hypothetical protein